ncbi:BTAD domain-containing putative transcriptional regulator [Streptomyces sp. NPDC086554]|uniref:AfsR/SARP family transcriptional regulator n=1 Tax=Streptomyces sp. NPDC086554 TaxID=3154864 RepID=UPI003443A1AB
MTGDLRLAVLGAVRIDRPDRSLDLSCKLPGYVLRILALRRGEVVPKDQLINGIYEGTPPRSAGAQLRAHVSVIRKALKPGAAAVDSVNGGYRLTLSATAALDLAEFEQGCHAGRTEIQDGRWREGERTLSRAVRLWGDLTVPDPVVAGIHSVINWYEGLHRCALEDWVESQLQLGQAALAIPVIEAALESDPLAERFRRLQLLALYRAGRIDRALAEFTRLRTLLADEMGLSPSPELERLHEQILNHDPALAPAAEARPSPALAPRQLPARPSGTARQADVAATAAALAGNGPRDCPPIVVMTGPPGFGKSTIAVEAAHRAAVDYPDGQLFAAFHAAGSGAATTHEILGRFLGDLGLGAAEIPGTPQERAVRFRSWTAGRRLLIVLDNVSAATQVELLLPSEPRCAVLITARTALCGLPQATHRIPIQQISAGESLSLLESHVGRSRVRTEPEEVRRVLQMCAGSMLALDTLGARMAARPNQRFSQVAERLAHDGIRLDEFEVGGRGVRDTLALSYVQLPAGARATLRKLCYLGIAEFPLQAVAALEDLSLAEAEDRLDPLLDTHFVTVARVAGDQAWFRVHKLTLAFGLERAAAEDSHDILQEAAKRAYGLVHSLSRRAQLRGDEELAR